MQRIVDFIETGIGNFNELALSVFAHQYQHCEAYQQYCRQLNKTPDQITAWQQIPAVSTDVFREVELCTLPLTTAKYVFQTSGTTAEIKGKHYYHDMTLYDSAIKNSFMSGMGLSKQAKYIFRVLTPSFVDVPTSSLFYMFHKIIEWYGQPQSQFYFHQNELNMTSLLLDLLEDVAHSRKVVLLGTAFSFVNFCDYLKNKGVTLKLQTGSRLLETGGLKGRTRSVSRNELYNLFSKYLGLDLSLCFSEYGMTELSSQCYSKPNSHVFQSPHWMQTRIIDPQSGNDVAVGEKGLVQFFDLANYTAISSIVTADIAIKQVDGFELIGRAEKAVIRGCSTIL